MCMHTCIHTCIHTYIHTYRGGRVREGCAEGQAQLQQPRGRWPSAGERFARRVSNAADAAARDGPGRLAGQPGALDDAAALHDAAGALRDALPLAGHPAWCAGGGALRLAGRPAAAHGAGLPSGCALRSSAAVLPGPAGHAGSGSTAAVLHGQRRAAARPVWHAAAGAPWRWHAAAAAAGPDGAHDAAGHGVDGGTKRAAGRCAPLLPPGRSASPSLPHLAAASPSLLAAARPCLSP